jgi:5'-nucleotidase/UDP-sugar diphosphatase
LENAPRVRRARGRALRIVLAAALLAACASLRPGGADLVRITLLQINDVYVLEPVDGGRRGGMARLATLVHAARRENSNTVFVLAGDTLSPSIESRFLRGAQMVAVLNAIGLDLATFGNHEFDFGPDVLRERMLESKFVWLSSNVADRGSGRAFGGASPDLLLTLDGVRVGVLGLTTPETARVSAPGPDVVFADPRAAGSEAASRLRARGAKLVVAVTHQGMAADRALAAAARPDVILGGHEHEPLIAEEGKTLITKAGSDARYLVQVDLWVTPDGGLVERAWKFREVSRRVAPDPAVEALVRHYAERLDADLDVVIGRTAADLEAHSGKLATGETNLGDFVADAVRERLQSDVALVNSGAIRGNRTLPAGPLTRRDVGSLLPFANVVMKLEMTGRGLRQALEHGLAQADHQGGGFLQVSGVRLVWDPARSPGDRIVRAEIGGRPLAADAVYTVAAPDYLYRGGDGFTEFARAKVLVSPESGPQLGDLVLAAIAGRDTIAPAVDDRLRRVGD